jgi:hypothetical protein
MTIPSGTNRDIERKNHFIDTLNQATKRVGSGFDHFGGYAALIGTETIQGVEVKVITANVEDVDSNDVKVLSATEDGGMTQELPTSASILSVVSTSSDDTLTGTGARVIFIEGLDDTFAYISEQVVMNGTTPVLTTNQFRRINNVIVVSVGDNASNVGIITMINNTTSNEMARIPLLRGTSVGANRLSSSVQTVPLGKTAFLISASISIVRSAGSSGVKEGMFIFEIDFNNNGVFLPFFSSGIRSDGSGYVSKDQCVMLPAIPEKRDFRIKVFPEVNNCSFNSNYVYLLVDNDVLGGI